MLSVADTGMGLAPELAERVFELFVQGKRGIDRSQGGLGIGLTLVKRLAELHGGSVAVSSAGENLGSEFTLRLPAIERPSAADSAPKLAVAIARSILVVEDNEDGRETLVTLLEMAGHRVESARDGVTGLEKALALSPDVGIIDIGLPGIDGMEFARRLRAAGERRIYLVALTGYGSDQDRERVLAAGFDAHVTKPVDISVLGALIARAPVRAPMVS